MSEPFVAEVRMVGFNFAPRGWALCDGQILPINQHQSLYSLLGTTYGGDGRTSFALPDLRGRTPIHAGESPGGGIRREGEKGGEEAHALSTNEMPQHTHSARASSEAASIGSITTPGTAVLATAGTSIYAEANNLTAIKGAGNTGGGQGHNNMQPYLAVNFCIALRGLFPSRN